MNNTLEVSAEESVAPEWVALVADRTAIQWSRMPDERLPIPFEFIATRAYFIWIAWGRHHGFHQSHWHQAELDMRRMFRQVVRWVFGAESDVTLNNHHDDKMQGPMSARTPISEQVIDLKQREDKMPHIQQSCGLNPFAFLQPDDWVRYAGQVLAIACDGGGILATATNIDELSDKMSARGIHRSTYLVQPIPDISQISSKNRIAYD